MENFGEKVHKLSLDGQDSNLLADYIFTSGTMFALIEFKYEEKNISNEKDKPHSKNICISLDNEENRKLQSLRCHYIGWSSSDGHMNEIFVNEYYKAVCNRQVFKAGVDQEYPYMSTKLRVNELVQKFLDGDIGTIFEDFDDYTSWLMENAGKGGQEIEVILNNPNKDESYFITCKSLKELHKFLKLVKDLGDTPTP